MMDHHGKPTLAVIGEYLTAVTDSCTCDGPFETYGHRSECGYVPVATISELRDAIRAAGLEIVERDNRMIKTVEELNELPPGSVIRVPGGTILERVGIEDFVEWWADGDVQPIVDDDLPALLLYLPPRG